MNFNTVTALRTGVAGSETSETWPCLLVLVRRLSPEQSEAAQHILTSEEGCDSRSLLTNLLRPG